MSVAPADAGEQAKLVEDLHHWHLLTRHLLRHEMPLHQVLQIIAEAVALRRLEVVHERKYALALGGVGGDHQCDRHQDTGERVAGEARGKRLGQGGGHGRIRGESGLWIFEL